MTKRAVAFVVLVVAAFAMTEGARRLLLTRDRNTRQPADGGDHERTPQRLISRAPSVTETVYALGLGDRLVGATPWCTYPEEAKTIPRTGTLLDPNYEKIVALEPDLVLVTTGMTSDREAKKLSELGINTMPLEQRTIDDVLSAITRIGGACRVEDRARKLRRRLTDGMNRLRRLTEDRGSPRVLIVVGREYSQPKVSTVHVAGNKRNFYHDILRLLNARNAYDGSGAEYPELGVEGLIKLNPDVIIEVTGSAVDDGDRLLPHWDHLKRIRAVIDGRVYVFTEAYAGRPGPRFVEAMELFAAAIYPDLPLEERP